MLPGDSPPGEGVGVAGARRVGAEASPEEEGPGLGSEIRASNSSQRPLPSPGRALVSVNGLRCGTWVRCPGHFAAVLLPHTRLCLRLDSFPRIKS